MIRIERRVWIANIISREQMEKCVRIINVPAEVSVVVGAGVEGSRSDKETVSVERHLNEAELGNWISRIAE